MIYLLHSTVPLTRGKGQEVRHYLGWSPTLESGERRVLAHQQGRTKVKIVQAYLKAGGTLLRARVWPVGGPALESYLKANGNLSQHCPICREAHLARRREWDTKKRRASGVPSREQYNAHVKASGGHWPHPKAGPPASSPGESPPAQNQGYTIPCGSVIQTTLPGTDGWRVRAQPDKTLDMWSAGTEPPSS